MRKKVSDDDDDDDEDDDDHDRDASQATFLKRILNQKIRESPVSPEHAKEGIGWWWWWW